MFFKIILCGFPLLCVVWPVLETFNEFSYLFAVYVKQKYTPQIEPLPNPYLGLEAIYYIVKFQIYCLTLQYPDSFVGNEHFQ